MKYVLYKIKSKKFLLFLGVKLEIDKGRNISLGPNEASNSSPAVNNNHINKRKKTKSSNKF